MATAQKTEIKKAVSAALREISSDPDFGLELRASFKRELEKSRRDAKAGRVRELRAFLREKKIKQKPARPKSYLTTLSMR